MNQVHKAARIRKRKRDADAANKVPLRIGQYDVPVRPIDSESSYAQGCLGLFELSVRLSIQFRTVRFLNKTATFNVRLSVEIFYERSQTHIELYERQNGTNVGNF